MSVPIRRRRTSASTYPDGHARPRRRRPRRSARASGRDRRPERLAASRRSSGTSTGCSGRPSGRVLLDGRDVAAAPRRRARRAPSGSRSRTRIARSSPAASGPRSRSGRGTWACGARRSTRPSPAPSAAVGLDERRGREPVRPRATRGGSCSRSRRSWRCGRRSSSSTSRRPARTPRGVGRVQAIVAGPGGGGPDRDRDQPRHALRGRDVRAGRGHARGRIVLDGTPAEVFAEAAWPVLASTYLEAPLAARAGARLGLGSTPTEAALVQALVARG